MRPTKTSSSPFTTVQDPNKVPGWPPLRDRANGLEPFQHPDGSLYPTAEPAGYPCAHSSPHSSPYPSPYPSPHPSHRPSPPPPLPPPPPPSASPATAAPTGPLDVPAVAGFKDRSHDLAALPAAALRTPRDAATRLAALKRRVNDLQAVRAGYWRKQAAAAAAGAVAAFGVGVVAAGAAGLHQRNRLEQVKKAIRAALAQINVVRFRFGGRGGSDAALLRDAERAVTIEPAVFTKGIARKELDGEL